MHSLLGRLSLIAGLFILAGALGAWLLSRRITQPIVALAHAADRVVPEMAPVTAEWTAAEPGRRDEVGRLTDAFTRMAARVDESRETLEARVAERTERLEAALHEL
jgi:nitrate/nitrite-specific signal transduction histidine kinase